MHPEMLRQISGYQIHDRLARADQVRVAKAAAKAARGRRRHSAGSDSFVISAIPDYVDGSFRVADEAGVVSGQIPAARTAA
jgi:hypothetical protein